MKIQMNIMMYKVYHVDIPPYLADLFRLTSEVHRYNHRDSRFDMQLPKPTTNFLKRSFSHLGAAAWNALPNHARELKK